MQVADILGLIFFAVNLLKWAVHFFRFFQPFFAQLGEAVKENEAAGDEAADHQSSLQVDRNDVQSGRLKTKPNKI